MIELLARFFIKDYKNYENPDVRNKYGTLCGIFGIFLNICLFTGKFILSIVTASVAMQADAFNNLSDAASSIVTIIGFKLSAKKADKNHPFGHGRIEYISGLIISFLILTMGVELFKTSIENIIHPEPVNLSVSSFVVMIIACLVKFYMYIYNHNISKKIKSVSLDATAFDSFSDIIATSVVIVSFIVSRFTTLPVDGFAGIIVALFILYTGLNAAQETIKPLLGETPSKELVDDISKEVLCHKPIIGLHDLVIHDYGPGQKMISLHAEVPGDMNIFELHDVIDNTEVALSKKFNCHTIIHMDPIDTKNEYLFELKEKVLKIIPEIDVELKVHDIRMVSGPTHTNLIFDVVRPFSCKLSESEILNKIESRIQETDKNVNCVITFDTPYVD